MLKSNDYEPNEKKVRQLLDRVMTNVDEAQRFATHYELQHSIPYDYKVSDYFDEYLNLEFEQELHQILHEHDLDVATFEINQRLMTETGRMYHQIEDLESDAYLDDSLGDTTLKHIEHLIGETSHFLTSSDVLLNDDVATYYETSDSLSRLVADSDANVVNLVDAFGVTPSEIGQNTTLVYNRAYLSTIIDTLVKDDIQTGKLKYPLDDKGSPVDPNAYSYVVYDENNVSYRDIALMYRNDYLPTAFNSKLSQEIRAFIDDYVSTGRDMLSDKVHILVENQVHWDNNVIQESIKKQLNQKYKDVV